MIAMQLWNIGISVTIQLVCRVLLFPSSKKEEDCTENGGKDGESADDTASDGTCRGSFFV